MKFDTLSRSTVKITLSEEDMREYSLCAKNLSKKNAETKRALAGFLKKAKLFRGFNTERLFLEAFPCETGGCVLYVSGLDEASENRKREISPLLCTVDGLDSFVKLCAGVYRFFDAEYSSAYAENGRYSLIVFAAAKQFPSIIRVMSEYGEVISDTREIFRLYEHAISVCPSGAARTFAKLM